MFEYRIESWAQEMPWMGQHRNRTAAYQAGALMLEAWRKGGHARGGEYVNVRRARQSR